MSHEIQSHDQEASSSHGEQQHGHPGEKNISNIEVSDLLSEEQIVFVDEKPPANIPRVTVGTTTEDYSKYYVPKVVSIGPYHYGNPNLMPVQDLKLEFAKDLFSTFTHTNRLGDLHHKLRQAEQELKDCYDISEKEFTSMEFTNMMLLDGCFVIYCLAISDEWQGTIFRTRKKLPNHQMISIRQDLLLLENQIPFQVLDLVGTHLEFPIGRIKGYINSLADRSLRWPLDADVNLKSGYLLQHLHLILIRRYKQEPSYSDDRLSVETRQHPNFPTAKELRDAGIHFQLTNKLRKIQFNRHRFWRTSATVKLYPLVVHGSTKLLFYNLIAYEASSFYISKKWSPVITSYIRLLDSLIAQPEDAKVLQDAGVIEDSQTFIKEIAADLYRVNSSFKETEFHIHQHYHRFKRFNKPISQFKQNYFNSPWSFLALVGAIIALLLTAVQTYFTVWGPKDECSDLCKFLKINHHL